MKAEQILKLYESGSYGTPLEPIRSSSVKSAFWYGYRTRSAAGYSGRVNHEAAKAGVLLAKQHFSNAKGE
tara:strand:- start:2967 stop:3176 length:210 start_codon:yes stop_codon:yes gene_type:complete